MSTTDSKLPRVCLLAAAETSPSILYSLYDVLSTTGVIYSELTNGDPGEPLLEVLIVAATKNPFRCFGEVMVEPHKCIDDVEHTDVAIVCDMAMPITEPPLGLYRSETEWLRRVHADGAILASVCSGSLVLAEAGLLDGLEASGHWVYREMFQEYYPKVKLRTELILSIAGERDSVVTAGGVTSWQELVLYLIARLCGRQHAVEIAKIYLLGGHDDGQLPFSVTTLRPQESDTVIDQCQTWIADNYMQANPVTQMISHSGLRPRTFARRFYSATGYQPIAYVHAIRIEEAKKLLEAETTNVDDIGHKVGYEDPTYFRRLFKRKTRMTPASYRKKFVSIATVPADMPSSTTHSRTTTI
jgi:transcriptional regulator GlxA family with amidase domain